MHITKSAEQITPFGGFNFCLKSFHASGLASLIDLYSESIPWLKATFRLKKFIFRFISVPAKWIRSGRRVILKLYTDKDYSPLLE